jgi:hypothetical protein
MKVEKLTRWHMNMLEKQGVVEVIPVYAYLDTLLLNGPAFAGMVDGAVVAAMGLVEQNKDNWRCWAITDPVLAKRYFLGLNKEVRAFFAEYRKPRIETIVLVGNVPGHRWVTEVLGFKPEGIMRKWDDGKHDAVLYSRVME